MESRYLLRTRWDRTFHESEYSSVRGGGDPTERCPTGAQFRYLSFFSVFKYFVFFLSCIFSVYTRFLKAICIDRNPNLKISLIIVS
jgi:hypothetical protein